MNDAQLASTPLPGFGEGLRIALRSAVTRPGLFLAILYAVAICFEQAVEVEVFKPYRLVGGAMILLTFLQGQVIVDKFAKLAIAFISIGFAIGLANSMLRSSEDSIIYVAALLWAFNILAYIALVTNLRSRRDIAIVAVIHALTMLVAAYGISGDDIGDIDLTGRQFGDFKNPANACVSMLFSAIVLLAMVRAHPRQSHLIGRVVRFFVMVGVAVFMFYTSTLTGSRAGAALLLVGVLTYLALTANRSFAIGAILAAVIVLVVALFSPLRVPNGISASGSNILVARIEKKGLDTDRLFLWRAGLDAFADSYGVGLGLMGYRTVHKEYFAKYATRSDPRWMETNLTLHSDYVSSIVEFGIVGAFVFILMCRRLVRMAKSVKERQVHAISIAMLIGIAINGLTHTGLPYFSIWFYFALLSAWVAAGRRISARGLRDGPGTRGGDLS